MTVAVAYRICGRHEHVVRWCGLVAPQHRRRTDILYATAMTVAVAYNIYVPHG
jgi:hypothetical protein